MVTERNENVIATQMHRSYNHFVIKLLPLLYFWATALLSSTSTTFTKSADSQYWQTTLIAMLRKLTTGKNSERSDSIIATQMHRSHGLM